MFHLLQWDTSKPGQGLTEFKGLPARAYTASYIAKVYPGIYLLTRHMKVRLGCATPCRAPCRGLSALLPFVIYDTICNLSPSSITSAPPF